MKNLLIGLLALGSISASAGSLVGKKALVSTLLGLRSGTIQRENANKVVVDISSRDMVNFSETVTLNKDSIEVEVPCVNNICKGEQVQFGDTVYYVLAVFPGGYMSLYDGLHVKIKSSTSKRLFRP